MTRSHFSTWLLSFALFVPSVACDSDDGGDDSAGDDGGGETGGGGGEGGAGGAGGDGGDGGGMDAGFTDCTPMGFEDTPTTCQPGQYCSDPNLADCEIGCLANLNCAEDQVCDIPADEFVGGCVNAGPTEPAVSEEELCTKLAVCDPSATAELCAMFYAGTNAACHQCILDENCGDINDFDGACAAACGL